MDSLVNLMVGSSTSIDVYVIVRLVVVLMGLEMFSVACAMLGNMKRR